MRLRDLSFTSEPTVWIACVRSLLMLAVLYGANLTPAQIAGTLLAFEAVLALFNRSQVTPNRDVVLAVPSSRTPTLPLLLLAGVLAIGVSGCGKQPPSLSPAGAGTWRANQAVLIVNTVQRTAINANETVPQLLSNANTRIVVDVASAARKTIAQTPTGWRETTTTALDQIRARLDVAGRTQMAAWLTLAATMVQEIR